MFSDPAEKMDVDAIFEAYQEPGAKNPKIDVVIEHYLSLVSRLKKDLHVLKDDLAHQKELQGDFSNSLEDFIHIKKLSAVITKNLNPDQILVQLNKFCGEILNFRRSEIFLVDQDEFRAVSRKTPVDFKMIADCARDEGILKWLWDQAHPIMVPLSDFVVYEKLKHKKGYILLAPMIQNHEGMGCYMIHSEDDLSKLSLRDLEKLHVLTQQAALAIQFSRLQQLIQEKTAYLTRAQERLTQMMRMATVGELSGGIAHEINNPLQVIMGNVQMARMGHKVDESLQLIEKQALRISNIVRGLLNMARQSNNTGYEYLEINSLIINTLELVRGQIEKRDIKIQLNLGENLPVVKCSSVYFQQILLNFILHAKMQIGQNGSITIESKTDHKESVVLEISDSGVRLPEEYIEKIKDPFSELDNSTEVNLGLAVSVQMIRDVGGKVEIQSGKSKGNKFTFQIPCTPKTKKSGEEKVASLG